MDVRVIHSTGILNDTMCFKRAVVIHSRAILACPSYSRLFTSNRTGKHYENHHHRRRQSEKWSKRSVRKWQWKHKFFYFGSIQIRFLRKFFVSAALLSVALLPSIPFQAGDATRPHPNPHPNGNETEKCSSQERERERRTTSGRCIHAPCKKRVFVFFFVVLFSHLFCYRNVFGWRARQWCGQTTPIDLHFISIMENKTFFAA